jgi:amidase
MVSVRFRASTVCLAGSMQPTTATASIALLPATELRRRLQLGELSAVQVTEACLAQVERRNGELNAVVTLNERALEDAAALDRARLDGTPPGLLFGLPVGIKDVTPVAGLRTTFGSPLYRDHVPAEDALIVRRIRDAGGIILGKTNTPEFAAGGNTFNDVFGRTRNPWNPARSAGGSTGGGAAALATGMIALAEGTDLGGSLRIPASFCGITGLRPSPGLVPTYPSDYVWDTLQVSGPMARTAADVALMLQAVCGPDPEAPLAQPVDGRDFVTAAARGMEPGSRIAYVADIAGIGVDPAIEHACRTAAFDLAGVGATVEEIELDLTEARRAFIALRGYWMIAQQHTRLEHLDAFGANVAGNIRLGLDVTTARLGEAEHVRGRLWHRFRELFTRYDAIVTPCMAVPPFPVEQNYPETVAGRPLETYVDWLAPTFVLSMTGLPVASVPCGLDPEGLPVALQVVGPARGEERALGIAAAIERLRGIGLPA